MGGPVWYIFYCCIRSNLQQINPHLNTQVNGNRDTEDLHLDHDEN